MNICITSFRVKNNLINIDPVNVFQHGCSYLFPIRKMTISDEIRCDFEFVYMSLPPSSGRIIPFVFITSR